MFKKILIANRGEIAIRIQRTCRELGIETVCVHSTADENSLHIKMADESVCIGPATSKDSYLNIQAIMSAVEITGADAVHPGYGFLAENVEFGQICQKYDVTFIGPNTKCIGDMGSKILSKELAEKAGVPILKTIFVKGRKIADVIKDVQTVGFPVLIKASAGGGGKGMQVIEALDKLESSIKRLERESLQAFGDGTLFIEKYIKNPRHIEVQVLGDKHGNVIHLGERDCTIQRRYQKIIEETPSPVLTPEIRKQICDSAVNLSKFVNYDSAGTIEYLYDMDDKKFYFMEMNTRIQVEHPVTEESCAIDLIAEQIKSAAGQKLSFQQSDIRFFGHVIECRVNAEDPDTFTPSPGLIDHYHRPGGPGIRVDDYIYTGYKVPPYYDSMVSKIIARGNNRQQCINRMKRALNETIVGGIKTNIPLHLKILDHPNFLKSEYSTNFINEHI